MTNIVSVDFETRSATDIRLGVERYSKDPECEVLMLAFRFWDVEQPFVWHRGPQLNESDPGRDRHVQTLLDYVADGGLIRGWNVMFEWHIWNNVCVPKYGWPPLALGQCVDTMAQAAAMNLPQALGRCAEVLGLPADKQKDKRGKYLIQRLCVPHPPTKTRAGKWVEDAALFEEFVSYCSQDVVVEETIARRLRPLSDHERRVWAATQRMNLRGLPVAVDEVRNINQVVEAEKERLNRELRKVTGRRVLRATDRNGLLAWVNERGLSVDFDDPVEDEEERPGHEESMPNMRAGTVESVLKRDDLPPDVRRALEIRAEVVQTSTAKFPKLLKIAADDGTLKNLFVYHGAGTGRWASRGGFNAQNITRPALLVNEKLGLDDIANAHAVLGSGDHDAARLLWGDKVMDAAVACLRGVIKAPEEHEFINADYSSVENRVGVWLAGQDDKIEMFAKGFDEYKVFASKSLYNVPYDAVTKDMRQMSKSAVLGCFAADTLVLTNSGWKRIVEVTTGDLLHDGVEFVQHDGVVYQGVKPVISLGGVQVTPDHKILEGESWLCAGSIQSLKLAVDTASGLLSTTSLFTESWRQKRSALAARLDPSLFTFCEREHRPGVSHAGTKSSSERFAPRRDTPTSWPAQQTGSVGLTGGLRQFLVAMTGAIRRLATTAAGAFLSATSGARTLPFSCAGSYSNPAGSGPSWSWTEGTTTKATLPAIVDWLRGRSSCETGAPTPWWNGTGRFCARKTSTGSTLGSTGRLAPLLESCAKDFLRSGSSRTSSTVEVPTYDVVNCGPRHRFLVLTEEGPVIAHNCLFGQGAGGLIEYAKGYGVTLTPDRSEEVVRAYRAEYRKVRNLWYACSDAAINAVRNPGEWFPAGDKLRLMVHKNFLWMKLPSGRLLAWSSPEIEMQEAPWTEEYTVYDENGVGHVQERQAIRPVVVVESIETKTRQWCRHKLIGSSIFQSAVQGTARDILARGMLNVEEAGYPVVFMAHDELMALVRAGFGSVEEFGALMCKPEDWYADLPLAFEGYRARRFKK